MKVYTGLFSDLAFIKMKTLVNRCNNSIKVIRMENGEVVVHYTFYDPTNITKWDRQWAKQQFEEKYINSNEPNAIEFKILARVVCQMIDSETDNVVIDYDKIISELKTDEQEKARRKLEKLKGTQKNVLEAECFDLFRKTFQELQLKNRNEEIQSNRNFYQEYTDLERKHDNELKELKRKWETEENKLVEQYLESIGRKNKPSAHELKRLKKLFEQ